MSCLLAVIKVCNCDSDITIILGLFYDHWMVVEGSVANFRHVFSEETRYIASMITQQAYETLTKSSGRKLFSTYTIDAVKPILSSIVDALCKVFDVCALFFPFHTLF